MKALVAHSNEKQVYRLTKSLESIGFNHIHTTDYGFEALDYIVRHNCKICLVEEYLKGLNAKDISNAIGFKGINIKFIILGADQHVSYKNSRNVIAKVDLDDTNALLRIMTLINREINALNISDVKSH